LIHFVKELSTSLWMVPYVLDVSYLIKDFSDPNFPRFKNYLGRNFMDELQTLTQWN